VEGHGKFDDVFVEYLDGYRREKHIFVQLKSKMKNTIKTERHTIAMEDLLAKKKTSVSAFVNITTPT
jgi:hypothetical protein